MFSSSFSKKYPHLVDVYHYEHRNQTAAKYNQIWASNSKKITIFTINPNELKGGRKRQTQIDAHFIVSIELEKNFNWIHIKWKSFRFRCCCCCRFCLNCGSLVHTHTYTRSSNNWIKFHFVLFGRLATKQTQNRIYTRKRQRLLDRNLFGFAWQTARRINHEHKNRSGWVEVWGKQR